MDTACEQSREKTLFPAEAHRKRVGALARSVGTRLQLNPAQLPELERAAATHSGFSDLDLSIFSETNPISASGSELLSGILQLANAFDEGFEWRVFEGAPGSEISGELELLGGFGLWPEAVGKAFRDGQQSVRQKALERAATFPVSAVGAVRRLAARQPDELTVDELERIAQTDPVLTAELLRHANLARYAAVGTFRALRPAIAHIGTLCARDVLLRAAARGLFASATLQRLWKHSLACANRMTKLARKFGLDENQAFLVGLLHDLGRVAFALIHPTPAADILFHADAPAIWKEAAAAGCDHAELGADILAGWNISRDITECIRHHHTPELSGDRLAALLYLVESVEGEQEDYPSRGRFESALELLQTSSAVWEDAVTGAAAAVAC